jgi:hypothetical protein
MAEAKERRKTPRNTKTATPRPDSQAGAPRTATSEPRSAPVTTGNARAQASPEEIRKLIAEAAYYKAKERGFQPGHELEDWVQAESEVMRRVERRT